MRDEYFEENTPLQEEYEEVRYARDELESTQEEEEYESVSYK